MKKLSYLLVFLVFFIKSQAQVPQTKSVTISPTAGNIQEVKGNIKATGIIESNTLKASGLASGNTYIANPVYANSDGTFVTGYKLCYYSIPPIAFHLNKNNNYVNPLQEITYSNYEMFVLYLNSDLYFITPLQIPHKSKLRALKLSFSFAGLFGARSVRIIITKTAINGSSEQNIVDFTTPTSTNFNPVSVNIPISLDEIDNENYSYCISIKATSEWNNFYLKSSTIEYQDF